MLRGTGISTHVPRTGHDGRSSSSLYALDVFQSTRPLRGATIVDGLRDDDKDKFQSTCPVRGTTIPARICRTTALHFNPRAPYGARRHGVVQLLHLLPISIHVPRTGHDEERPVPMPRLIYFNPRAPYGARLYQVPGRNTSRNFNPRAPYGARQQKCTNSILHFCNNRQ